MSWGPINCNISQRVSGGSSPDIKPRGCRGSVIDRDHWSLGVLVTRAEGCCQPLSSEGLNTGSNGRCLSQGFQWS